jgi:dihydropyrimidine dehydrogenase (NAD+) subunit PreT
VLRPAGPWGHGVGVVATGFMMMNFLYSVRKRWRRLKGTATIRTWLTFHMFVGFMSPLVIAFHAAFQSNNQLATATASSLLVVVLTGVIGRYVYGLVPAQGASALELSEVMGRFENLRAHVEPLLAEIRDPAPLRQMFEAASADAKPSEKPRTGAFLGMLFSYPLEVVTLFGKLLWVTRDLPARDHAYEFRSAMMKLHRIKAQVQFYRSLKGLLRGWRVFHAVTASLLVVMIAAHIAVSLFLGYRWIF